MTTNKPPIIAPIMTGRLFLPCTLFLLLAGRLVGDDVGDCKQFSIVPTQFKYGFPEALIFQITSH
jgi:hypothetical protein